MRHWFKDQHFRSLLKNTSYLAVSKGVAAVAGIATLAMSGRALGLEAFGLLVLIASYAQAVNGLTKFQSWQLVVRYGGAGLARGEPEDFRRASGFALGLDLVSGLVGLVLAMAVLPLVGGWFGLEGEALDLAFWFCLLIPAMGASSPSGMLRALDRFDLISWQGTVTPIARAVLAAIGYAAGWGLAEFVLIWAATMLVGDLYLFFLAWRELRRRGIRGVRPTLKPGRLEAAWPFAIKTNITYSLESAWKPLARLVVGGLLGPASAALYRVAASLADSAQKPADLLAKAYYPEVVRMNMASKHPWKLMLRGIAMAGAFGLAAVLFLALAGEPLITLLFGPEFTPVYPVLMVMMAVPLLAIVAFPLPPMLYALDRPDAPLKARIAGTLAYFALVAPLCWEFDLIGAALALIAAHLVMVAVLLVILRREHRRVRAK
jgi:O-antigen/teichoic acid export membrane protein